MKVLIYSPHLDGHPQVYCRVIGDILLEHGARLVLAAGECGPLAERWPDLAPLCGREDVAIVFNPERSAGASRHLTLEELRTIQEEYRVDSTLFIEPEFFREEFVRIWRKRAQPLLGRNVGIFGGTTEWYPREEFYSGRRIGRFDGSLRANLGKLKRRILKPWTFDRYFFETMLIGGRLLDVVIVKDERVAEAFPGAVRWLPEIYKVFGAADTDAGRAEFDAVMPGLCRFLERFEANDRVIYFGAGAWYKGYDYFVQLLTGDPSSAGIHAGAGIRFEIGKPFVGDPEASRVRLLEQGRLFETGGYVRSQRLIDHIFRSAKRFVSTHRLTVSSGTMLHALDYGLPVLVPDTGLVGHRARAARLGRTYRYGDTSDLVRQWIAFKHQPVEAFRGTIEVFMRRFKREAVERLFVEALLRDT